MLKDFQANNIDHPCMITEGKWLGECFDDFLKRIPQEHLLNQLYMFSSQNEQDSRDYAKLSVLPMLETSSVEEAIDMM